MAVTPPLRFSAEGKGGEDRQDRSCEGRREEVLFIKDEPKCGVLYYKDSFSLTLRTPDHRLDCPVKGLGEASLGDRVCGQT
jgi:hypothetical protein